MSIGVIGISDIHLFNRRNLTFDIVNNLNKYFIPVLETGKIKLLLIAGDLFDRRLQFNHDDTTIAIEWMYHLLSVCKKHNIILRILEGTPSHDWEQSKHFIPACKFYKNVNVQWINKISIEHIPEINKSILYIPDEATESTEITLGIVKELMYKLGIDSVDIGCMHGMFKYQMPNIDLSEKNYHKEEEYLKIVKGPIIIGHIHKHKPKSRIIPPGSFDRLAFNEEEDKGFIQLDINETDSSIYKKKFIVNKGAKKFEYLKGNLFADLNELYTHLDKKVTMYPIGSYISIQTFRKSFIDDNLVDIQNRYASKINIERVLLDKKENVLISTDLKQQEYTPLQITQNNIKELLTNRMKTNLVDQENITEAMLILEDILNA